MEREHNQGRCRSQSEGPWCHMGHKVGHNSRYMWQDRKDGSQPWTRRPLLRAVASLFDPLGLVLATHLTRKILLQRAWQETNSWDQPLGPQLAACVEIWWGEIQHVKDVSFPRRIHANHDTTVAVNVFADPSEKAYGCCIFVVVGQTRHLVISKTKVSPLKALTLPRLELQAASLAASHLQFILSSLRLHVSEITAWSDSTTVLRWIK